MVKRFAIFQSKWFQGKEKALFANQKVPSKKRATGSDSENWNAAEDSGKKTNLKNGYVEVGSYRQHSSFRTNENLTPGNMIFEPRSIGDFISYSKKTINVSKFSY